MLGHAPCLPDLAPCHFFLFPKIKFALKDTRFVSNEEVKQKSAEFLSSLTKQVKKTNKTVCGDGSTLKGKKPLVHMQSGYLIAKPRTSKYKFSKDKKNFRKIIFG